MLITFDWKDALFYGKQNNNCPGEIITCLCMRYRRYISVVINLEVIITIIITTIIQIMIKNNNYWNNEKKIKKNKKNNIK